ncbi:unnamed protein product [Gulo gulo]|uniref:Uncharacterized protein n=1 Tax=Gulo gulo TaxID=48420 RepID=A0A9X9ME61_GULGU|nr:unnamed protein product [Gulo gulo]
MLLIRRSQLNTSYSADPHETAQENEIINPPDLLSNTEYSSFALSLDIVKPNG